MSVPFIQVLVSVVTYSLTSFADLLDVEGRKQSLEKQVTHVVQRIFLSML